MTHEDSKDIWAEAWPSIEYWVGQYPDGTISEGAFEYEMEQTKRRVQLLQEGKDPGARKPPEDWQLRAWDLFR